MKNVGWISSYMQALIEPPPIPLINLDVDDDSITHIIKVKMWRNASSAASEMYYVNMNTFDYVQTKELISLPLKTSISELMGPELHLHPVGLTNYLRCYMYRHWGNSTNYSLNTVVRTITTSILFSRVYLSISSRSMRFPIKSARWGKNEQLPAALPRIGRPQENLNGGAQRDYPPHSSQWMVQKPYLQGWDFELYIRLD